MLKNVANCFLFVLLVVFLLVVKFLLIFLCVLVFFDFLVRNEEKYVVFLFPFPFHTTFILVTDMSELEDECFNHGDKFDTVILIAQGYFVYRQTNMHQSGSRSPRLTHSQVSRSGSFNFFNWPILIRGNKMNPCFCKEVNITRIPGLKNLSTILFENADPN